MDDLVKKPYHEWRCLIDGYVENTFSLPAEAPIEARRVEERSERSQVFRELLAEAEKAAKAKGLGPHAKETTDLFDKASDIAYAITAGTYIPRGEQAMKLDHAEAMRVFSIKLYAEARSLDFVIRQKGARDLDKAAMEEGVGRYLAGPFRSAYVDRLLLFALTDMEIEAFLGETIRPAFLQKKSNYDLANTSLFALWIKGRFWSLVRTVLVTAAAFGVVWIWPDVPAWIPTAMFLLAVGGFILSTVVSAAAGFFAARKWNTTREKTVALVDGMRGFFAEFRTSGPISVPYVRRRLEELAAIGVVWPVPIWALLDDFEKRGIISV